MLTFPDRTKRD